MHLICALFLGAAVPAVPTSYDNETKRAALVNAINIFDAALVQRAREFTQGPDPGVAAPRTGLTLASAEQPGPDGLHELTVVSVVQGSPGDVAGILHGDRIVALGQRRIEHETVVVVEILLEQHRGPVTLTLSRNGTAVTAVVNRAPIACLRRALELMNPDEWRVKLVTLQATSSLLRTSLDDPSMPLPARYEIAVIQLERLFQMLNGATGEFSERWSRAESQACTPDFAQAKEAQ